jgi:hypothetical protein
MVIPNKTIYAGQYGDAEVYMAFHAPTYSSAGTNVEGVYSTPPPQVLLSCSPANAVLFAGSPMLTGTPKGTLLIPSGSSVAPFKIYGQPVTAPTTVTIYASCNGGVPISNTITIMPKP